MRVANSRVPLNSKPQQTAYDILAFGPLPICLMTFVDLVDWLPLKMSSVQAEHNRTNPGIAIDTERCAQFSALLSYCQFDSSRVNL